MLHINKLIAYECLSSSSVVDRQLRPHRGFRALELSRGLWRRGPPNHIRSNELGLASDEIVSAVPSRSYLGAGIVLIGVTAPGGLVQRN
jgi:hypothetical protein